MIEIEYRTIRVGGREITLDYPVYDARLVGEMVLVLFRPESFKGGQFQNLVALDLSGRELWKAELPTTSGRDAYYEIVSDGPIIANSYCSYRCTIDAKTGKITQKEFYK